MTAEPSDLEILVTVSNEVEAAAIVSALLARDVHATAAGGYISGFKAEAPGDVKVLVRHTEAHRAREVLDQLRQDVADIDWSEVDLGEPE
jgi:hypothetical protein